MTGALVLMGSGETTPTMVTTHKRLLAAVAERTGRAPTARLLNTPYGFQENAGEITAKAQQYFSHNVEQDVELIDLADVESLGGAERERRLDAIRQSTWLFAGPGSPTYALRQWSAAPVRDAMVEVFEAGGTVVLASAAAVTGGSHAIPVYEVYKAGQDAHWVDGLDLVNAAVSWPCVVIPHFDNAEGGTHDTRFCYLGERRLRMLEGELPEGTWILGVDEHTALIIEGDTVSVEGRGAAYVRYRGQIMLTIPAGTSVPAADVASAWMGSAPDDAGAGTGGASTSQGGAPAASPELAVGAASSPMVEQLADLRTRFDRALVDRDADEAVAATLDTQALIRDWSGDSLDSDEMDRAVAQLRGMITRLGVLAAEGMHDHRQLVSPLIETLLHVRDDARSKKAYEVADHIRDHMDADGVSVKDTREGTEWEWDEPPL
ncbi:hypothetical protein [Euzebya tangerina]|uniref:hypothetical protein n=1 Tax=Euzebya tangerina TaxID=591198 RepID=UPI0013C37324|nr:hypothetical protein [Euzebya tangerina]